MEKGRKVSFSEVPGVILTFVFVALIGGVGMIILGEFKSDTTDTNATKFIADAQIGVGKIGNKLGLVGTIIVLAVIIGLVISYFSIRNM